MDISVINKTSVRPATAAVVEAAAGAPAGGRPGRGRPHVAAAGEAASPEEGVLDHTLSSREERTVEMLKRLDLAVRIHEQQHVAAAGAYARGGPVFDVELGPDDHPYAVGGHVSIDTQAVAGNPEATRQKAQVIRQAAFAVAQPSPGDLHVALAADQLEQKVRNEEQSSQASGGGHFDARATVAVVAAAYGGGTGGVPAGILVSRVA